MEKQKDNKGRDEKMDKMLELIEAKKRMVEAIGDVVFPVAIAIFIVLMGLSVLIACFMDTKSHTRCVECNKRISCES